MYTYITECRENGEVKLLWDVLYNAIGGIEARKPDVLYLKKEKSCIIIVIFSISEK